MSCAICGRRFTPNELRFEYEDNKMLCGFCDARVQGILPPAEPFEYPHCPICALELWLEYDEQGREHWRCPEPEKHPEGSETINGENIAPPYRYFE